MWAADRRNYQTSSRTQLPKMKHKTGTEFQRHETFSRKEERIEDDLNIFKPVVEKELLTSIETLISELQLVFAISN